MDEGENVTLTCGYYGHPTAQIVREGYSWERVRVHGRTGRRLEPLLPKLNTVHGESGQYLTVVGTQRALGEYKCSVLVILRAERLEMLKEEGSGLIAFGSPRFSTRSVASKGVSPTESTISERTAAVSSQENVNDLSSKFTVG